MDALIALDQITKDYHRLRALDEVSVVFGPGITGLLGPNGAGKSTLIKVVLGLVRTTGGTGTVLGHRLGDEARAIRAAVGYMPEDDCYIAGLMGVEMVRFAARLSGLPSIEALRRAHEILDFCGIEQERYRDVDTYSTGMRQKLKFAQSIVHDPPLLILDEPTAGLDPEERDAMLSRIQVLSRRAGKAVIISTHILPDVQTICNNVVILAKGRVRTVDSLEALSRPTSPRYELRVFGNAQPLVERIRRAGMAVRAAHDGLVTVDQVQDDFTDRVWDWAREAEVGIRSLAAARNSLEQIFLDAVREEQQASPTEQGAAEMGPGAAGMGPGAAGMDPGAAWRNQRADS
jgi:ABC-2 type transport system ATP-binding protein